MSRVVDLTKPLNELDEDDLRYIHDRNLISDPADAEKVGEWLRKKDEKRRAEGPQTPEDLTRVVGASPGEAIQTGEEVDPEKDEMDGNQPPGTEPEPQYDPSEHNVDDVVAHMASLGDDGPAEEERERIRAAERLGKNRKGITGDD